MFYGWRVAGAAFLAWAISIGPRQAFSVFLVHQVAYLVDAGYSRMAAASFYAISSVLAIPSGLTAGMASDRLGFLLGLQNIGFGAGAMLGPVFAGALFDWLGSYTLAFLASAAAALGSAAVISAARVIREPARE